MVIINNGWGYGYGKQRSGLRLCAMRVAELARAGGPMWAVHTMCSACGGGC